ncbi:hypothetical protein GpartN1_g1175.t1 [Galdieria partita]|uniref:Uncharacterized protein n=1 Tax=Galdieria partita TaxID=83374 RepID=A0A9C7UN22_9RHOD|nr:hypothetical protein GpartN1_g1175.t1 [Galdieria partita]
MVTVDSQNHERVVIVEYKESLQIIKLCRPASKNAFNDKMYEQCIQALEQAASNPAVLAVVFTGEGDFFSSGADVKQRNDKHLFQMESTVVGRFMKLLAGFPKLVIAAVNGPAVGIGVTLLLQADIVYCTRKAWFWTPFSFLGLAPEYASSVMLPDIVGIYKANEMLILGKRVSAEEALQFHLVAQIFDSRSNEEFLEAICKNVLESIAQIAVPEKGIPLFKQLIKSPKLASIENAMKREFAAIRERAFRGEPQQAFQRREQRSKPSKERSAVLQQARL